MLRSALSVCAFCAVLVLSSRDGLAQAQRINVETAIQTALANHPDIMAAAASASVARGNLRTAYSFTNPEFGFSVGPARGSDTSLTSFEIGFGQLIEVGGKRGARRNAAASRVRSAEAGLARHSHIVAFNARRTFELAIVAQDRATAAIEADSIGAALVRAATERRELGVGTQLDVNVATAVASRDKRARLVAEQSLHTALLEFRTALGISPNADVVPEGDVALPAMPGETEDELVLAARQRRADLAMIEEERRAAEADHQFARALAWPDPVVGISVGRNDFRSRMLSIGIALPLWNRSRGSRVAAAANLELAKVTETAALHTAERQVREAYRAFAQATEAAQSLERDVVGGLGENLALAMAAFENGKISLITYSTIRRELVAARIEYFDALADVIERRYQLSAAIGGEWE